MTMRCRSFGTPNTLLFIAASALSATAAFAGVAISTRPDLAMSEHALLAGEADRAVSELQATLAANPGDGEAHLLLCRVWLSEAFAEKAAAECHAALADGLAHNSEAQDWTGRALGAEAQEAGMLTGFHLAGQVREAFETAVALDPSSEAANVDLGEFYTAAPALVGGGNGKALALAAHLEHTLPAVTHRIRAMAAERDKDYALAEREFQAEVAVNHSPGALVDLAAYYERRQNGPRTVEVARDTIARDRQLDATAVEAALILNKAHQTAAAEQTLRDYLERGEKSDQAPAFRVFTELGSIHAQSGNKPAARQDYQRALALAAQYRPAQKGLGAL